MLGSQLPCCTPFTTGFSGNLMADQHLQHGLASLRWAWHWQTAPPRQGNGLRVGDKKSPWWWLLSSIMSASSSWINSSWLGLSIHRGSLPL